MRRPLPPRRRRNGRHGRRQHHRHGTLRRGTDHPRLACYARGDPGLARLGDHTPGHARLARGTRGAPGRGARPPRPAPAPREAVAPTRAPETGPTFRANERLLAGFEDGRTDEGRGPGEPTLRGLSIAREQGWTAPKEETK